MANSSTAYTVGILWKR